jgi:hypothetical protein
MMIFSIVIALNKHSREDSRYETVQYMAGRINNEDMQHSPSVILELTDQLFLEITLLCSRRNVTALQTNKAGQM